MSSGIYIFSDYFDAVITLLKVTSFWIYDGETKILQHSYTVSVSIYMFFIYLPCEILFVVFAFNDLDLFVRSLRDIGNHIALIYKAINFFWLRKHILDLIERLRDQPIGYEEFNTFRPKLIVEKHRRESIKWTRNFLYFVNGIVLTMIISGLFVFTFKSDEQYIVTDKNITVYRQTPPVNIVSPFGNETKLQFLITFFFTIIGLSLYAWTIIALDSLFITLMSCLSAHLEILQGAFETMKLRCELRLKRNFKNQDLKAEMDLEMVECIKHLQNIFYVSEKLEHIYNGQTLFQTFISLGEMCFSLYLLSQELDENTGNEITYLMATAFELLMYCRFGNQITDASIALSFSLYSSDWLVASSIFKKQLIFTLTRLKRPIYITIGKFTPLTYSTFLTIVRGAYSFFTFLKQRDGISNKM